MMTWVFHFIYRKNLVFVTENNAEKSVARLALQLYKLYVIFTSILIFYNLA
jgi:hypothetical protein